MKQITAEPREVIGKKVKELRRKGIVPAAIYGPKRESTNIQVNAREFDKLFSNVGFNKFFDIELGGKSSKVLVKELQRHPLKDYTIMVNFYEVDENSKITVDVPVNLLGESPAVKQNLGFLVQQMDTIALYCLPKDLPDHLEVDISTLEHPGQSINVSDIKLNEAVELDSSVDSTSAVVYIAAPQKEEVEEAPVAAEGEAGAEGEAAAPAEGGEAEGEKKEE